MKKTLLVLSILFCFICIVMPVAAGTAPMRDDGQLKYSVLTVSSGTYGMRPAGHAVYFTNDEPIIITGVRLYGCKYGDNTGDVRFEIWDGNMKTLYSDTVSYGKIPFTSAATQDEIKNALSWKEITLPDHLVTGNFYYVIFTDSAAFSANGHGIRIGFTQPTTASTSHAVVSNPNGITEKTISGSTPTYTTNEVDWMIRPLYRNAPATPATTPQATATAPVQPIASPATAAAEQGTPVPAPSTPAPTTKAPVEACVMVAGLVLGIYLRNLVR